MNKIIIISFFALFMYSPYFASAQKDTVIDITAKIINRDTGKPVAFATIVNIKKNTAILSDTAGYFHFTILKSDILRISAIGYRTANIFFTDSAYSKTKIYNITLVEKTYPIAKVNIYEARWKDFEYEFANLEIKKDETQERIIEWFQSIISTQDLALITSAAAIGIPINYKTKSERQKIIVAEFEKKDEEDRLIAKKFNNEIVAQLTGLKIEDTEKFILYCNFNRIYLLSANEYEIATEIKKRYNAYSKKSKINFE